ncbi:bifunctional 2-keto-4-hydroxyglutarate aldolase/2-keto-3-deoxy-6-phosphogluconate aldolase [Aquibacillus albus]|uniref:2-dehydro-3-deoxyphosphogluconate aldolase/(4S)-4-hydroxy-2-oxoglutarate aldolase n=1 Tax=Aquibacillus albus TaxID=1168171 RepID=A0ABS2MVM7_9BACI|nr:bifunctional 2-keto-4-hydroxyglutarate aldolase/2-keto-3-deoxy-6-phosphogluconate aldolase [Aquibacillus albus]MBM7569962.1 2-dehydro-3-deoxyphosphogluconate aldolase/(4S)-4-hydroxy-2-oxoglutarate aldolase [Aquibacillus albus]
MLNKWEVLNKITESGLVVVVRADTLTEAKKITEACLEGGAAAIEITYTVPNATRLIEELSNHYGEDAIIGAGTVLDSETARIAMLAGAKYIVSPYLDKDTLKLCNRYQIPYMPGVMTIESAVEAMELGADLLKLFPGEAFGPKMIKSIKGPLPQANLMPTGGVSPDNVGEWINNGAVAVGVGGSLTASAKQGDYGTITRLASNICRAIKEARQG